MREIDVLIRKAEAAAEDCCEDPHNIAKRTRAVLLAQQLRLAADSILTTTSA